MKRAAAELFHEGGSLACGVTAYLDCNVNRSGLSEELTWPLSYLGFPAAHDMQDGTNDNTVCSIYISFECRQLSARRLTCQALDSHWAMQAAPRHRLHLQTRSKVTEAESMRPLLHLLWVCCPAEPH